jgi:DNA polymerase-3 subunit epsilon
VKDAPKFAEIVIDLCDFIGDAPIIAHNAQFDRNFIDHEFGRCGRALFPEDRWIDTLKLAQTRFPGMANSLDALCKRFKVSLVERTLHGALIDARLLAEVYLELKGGKERRLDLSASRATVAAAAAVAAQGYGPRPRSLPGRIHEAEQAAHLAFLQANLKDRSLWAAYGVEA